MTRRASRINSEWETPASTQGFDWQHVQVEVLMDIRDELKRMNTILHCHNTLAIPHTLARIDRRLAKNLPLRKRDK